MWIVDSANASSYDSSMMQDDALLHDSTKSGSVAQAAARLLPQRDRTATPTTILPREQPVLARASGAVVTDVDGQDYIDFVCGHGSLLLGHGDDRIIAAITKATSKGCALGETTEARVRLAELIISRFPSVDMVQFTSSRAGALREVERLSRAYTGRRTIIIPEHTRSRQAFSNYDDIVSVPFADINAMDSVSKDASETPGAVLVEPVGTDHGVHSPPDGYLAALRGWCDRHNALLVFDESVTALRFTSGGVGEQHEVKPDITCFGTSITGGMAAAAYGGRRDLMQAHAASDEVHMPLGDIGHEPSLAAGVALLQATAEEEFHRTLEARASAFERGLLALAPRKRVAIEVHRVGSLIGFHIVSTSNQTEPFDASGSAHAVFFRELIRCGVLFPMPLPVCLYVSSAHTEPQLAETVEAVEAALDAVDHVLQ